MQLVIDYYACIEYLAKYAAKSENVSLITKDAFENIVRDVSDESFPKLVLQELFIKSVGEQDMVIQDVIH